MRQQRKTMDDFHQFHKIASYLGQQTDDYLALHPYREHLFEFKER